jgi:hypothetical protein
MQMKFLKIGRMFFICLIFLGVFFAQAETSKAQLLPQTQLTTDECRKGFSKLDEIRKTLEAGGSQDQVQLSDLLGCAIKTGQIKLWMIPFFATYILNFVLAIAGLVSVLFIVIGGYQYILGGATGQADQGKTTVINAVIGLVVILTAWIVVNVIQYTLT